MPARALAVGPSRQKREQRSINSGQNPLPVTNAASDRKAEDPNERTKTKRRAFVARRPGMMVRLPANYFFANGCGLGVLSVDGGSVGIVKFG